jgi:pimeloyl-ACP methyl ester carboxylesterase
VGEALIGEGVVERRFDLDVDRRLVPGILWTPSDVTGPRPIVLVGHGATRHKRIDHIVALARTLVRRHQFAVTAIDCPAHGERRADPDADEIQVFADFLAEWSRPGSVDDMIAEWAATLEAVRALDDVGDGPVGYWGLSMGTIFGLPFTAAEPRVQVAVFGLMGLVGPTRERLAADAAKVNCPVLFIQQWDDQLLPRPEVLALFDALATVDKRLHAHPGDHSSVPVEEVEFSINFLARHLGG